MIGPPNAAGGSANAAHHKLTSTRILVPPAATINRIRQREAGRLLAEYWRTGDPKHLAAFCRHFIAMRADEARAAQ
jgi:hypothetical protein